MNINITWRYVAAFLFLTVLCGTSHEFVHHFAGALVCGEFGYKTFNSFVLPEGCRDNPYKLLATAAGPLFTFALLWLGLYRMRRRADEKSLRLGFALIFANFPINRLLFALLGANDEQYIASQLFGKSALAYWTVNLIIWLCAAPPIYFSYKIIKNNLRFLWFAGFFILPFAFVVVFAGLFLENYLLLERKILAGTILGIPYLIMLVEAICLTGYALTKKYLYCPNTVKKTAEYKIKTERLSEV